MLVSSFTPRRLAAFTAACLLSVALPAWSQEAQTENSAPASTATPNSEDASTSEFSVEIPTIEAVDSNVDEDTLRDIFSGNVVDNAQTLAGLTASSITIPQITLTGSSTIEDETTHFAVTFSDIVFSDVTDGTAASVTLGGSSTEADEASFTMGAVSASNFDIAGVLALYGLVDGGGQTELETIYTDLNFAGGTISSPEFECTIGAAQAAEFKARPLNYSFADIMALAEALEKSEDDAPNPEVTGDALRMYVDLLTAFETTPITFDGFECSGVDEEDRPIAFSVAGMSMGAMKPGYYPAYSVQGVDISVEGDGSISLGSLQFKGMDLTGPIAAIQNAPEAIDEAWFVENARSLIPAFEGFAFSDVAIDIPDEETPGGRIVGGVGGFDLTLGSYVNGVPTDISTSATNITGDIPAETEDAQLLQLRALGVESLDLGFALKAHWNEAEDTIELGEFSFSGADLVDVKLAGTILNATEELFGNDNAAIIAAAMGVTIANLNLDVTDLGLSDLILASVAADQGSDPAAMRPVFAGLAEGTIVGVMAGAAEAQKVGSAINSFVSGKARNLNIDLVSKEPTGLSFDDFMAAETDPTVLIGKVTINATAK